jgi:hypothetical protein
VVRKTGAMENLHNQFDAQAEPLEGRFSAMPAFPTDSEPPLPPPLPWYRRLPRLIWRLFPATLVCMPLVGASFLFLGFLIGDMLAILLVGVVFGAVVGLYFDVKRSVCCGEMMDD